VFNNNPTSVDLADIPTAIFTTPEFASVGFTEEEARKGFSDVHIYKAQFRPMRATLSGRDEQVLMKLIVGGESHRILGLHMVGADAGEIAQMAAIAIRMKATKADFDATVALHPSAAEEFVNGVPYVQELDKERNALLEAIAQAQTLLSPEHVAVTRPAKRKQKR
jgi:glutathione reductase (NADPH)